MEFTTTETLWRRLGSFPPQNLKPARDALHWAAQAIAALGFALATPKDDDSHSNILWSTQRQGFFGRRLPSGHRAFLEPETFQIGILGSDEREILSFSLVGRTLQQTTDALADALREQGVDLPWLTMPTYDLPEHPVQNGAPFEAQDSKALGELSRWYHDASVILAEIASMHAEASAVRGWPHHFDLATLLTFPAQEEDHEGRSVGVGMTPGDDTIPEPYFYVTPWPAPDQDKELPALPHGGSWHRDGWTGAILRAQDLTKSHTPHQQMTMVREFLLAATQAGINEVKI